MSKTKSRHVMVKTAQSVLIFFSFATSYPSSLSCSHFYSDGSKTSSPWRSLEWQLGRRLCRQTLFVGTFSADSTPLASFVKTLPIKVHKIFFSPSLFFLWWRVTPGKKWARGPPSRAVAAPWCSHSPEAFGVGTFGFFVSLQTKMGS